jgi:hypothetical protein
VHVLSGDLCPAKQCDSSEPKETRKHRFSGDLCLAKPCLREPNEVAGSERRILSFDANVRGSDEAQTRRASTRTRGLVVPKRDTL